MSDDETFEDDEEDYDLGVSFSSVYHNIITCKAFLITFLDKVLISAFFVSLKLQLLAGCETWLTVL